MCDESDYLSGCPPRSERHHSQMALSFHAALPEVCPLVVSTASTGECSPSLVSKGAVSLLCSLQRPLFLFRFCHHWQQWKDIDLNVFSFVATTHILSLCVLARNLPEMERETLHLSKTFYLPFKKAKASGFTVWDVDCKALQKYKKYIVNA